MVAPVSPSALIISTAMPDGQADLPNFIMEMAIFSISMGWVDLPVVVHQAGIQDPSQIPRCGAFHNALASQIVLSTYLWN